MTDITVLRLLMDGVAKIRRASEQLRSVEEIQPWWGIPWSRVDRHFVAIDNRGARRIGERDNAAPNGSRCAECAAPSQFAAPSAGLRRPPRGCDGLRCPDGR